MFISTPYFSISTSAQLRSTANWLTRAAMIPLPHHYLWFWSISLFQISPSEIIMSWMSFASGIYFLVVPEWANSSTILSILLLINFIDGPAYSFTSVWFCWFQLETIVACSFSSPAPFGDVGAGRQRRKTSYFSSFSSSFYSSIISSILFCFISLNFGRTLTGITQPSKQLYFSSHFHLHMMYFSILDPLFPFCMLAKIFFPAFVMVYYCYWTLLLS